MTPAAPAIVARGAEDGGDVRGVHGGWLGGWRGARGNGCTRLQPERGAETQRATWPGWDLMRLFIGGKGAAKSLVRTLAHQ